MHAAAQVRSRRIWRLTMFRLGRQGGIRLSLGTHGFAPRLCAIVLLAAALRVYALDYQSLWGDEIFSLITTDPRLSLSEFWDRVGRHPSADLLPASAAVVVRLWAIGTRRPRTECGLRHPDPLRRRNIARLLLVAQRPSRTPAAHRRLSGRGMV